MNRTLITAFALLLAAVSTTFANKVGEPIEDIGTTLDLPDQQFLQLTVKERHVAALFYDDSETIIESPAESIIIVVDQPGHKNDEIRLLLKPSAEDASLTSKRLFYSPYNFKARVIIRFTDKKTKTFPYAALQLDRNVE